MKNELTIAVVGGTGAQGKGLAYRFARHGHTVILGSRAASKAEEIAASVAEKLANVPEAGAVTGRNNLEAVEAAQVVLIAVPYEGHDDLVASLPLEGKTVISCVNPLSFDKRGAHGQVVDNGEGSAAESAQKLAPEATVVGAFHNVAASALWSEQDYLDDDVIVVGDSTEGKQVAIELASTVTGRPGLDGGKLRLARVLEPLTAVLISINRKYQTHSGISVTGVPRVTR